MDSVSASEADDPGSTPGTRTIAIKDLRYIYNIPVLFLSELN